MTARDARADKGMIPKASGVAIAAVGDIFPGDHYFSLGHGIMSRTAQGTLDDLFSEVAPILQGADLAICNLEGPLSHGSAQRSRVEGSAFRGLPQFCRLLKDAGFTHVNVANNHISQHGPSAFNETVHALKTYGLQVVGLSGLPEGRVSLPVISRIDGQTMCIVGYSAVKEHHSSNPCQYAFLADQTQVISEIASLSREYDHVIVSCHAGDEGMPIPSQATASMYRQFIDAGARCVLGHHPHIFQPIERYRDSLIAYSLGDFAFDLFWDTNATRSAILVVRITAASTESTIVPAEFSRDYRVRKVSDSRAREFIRALDAHMLGKPLDDRAYAIALATYERSLRYSKALYFLRNIGHGDIRNKTQFLLSKLLW
jgi:poly-gamma-glutamate synthesis protein (capsule biosynthesis protein)